MHRSPVLSVSLTALTLAIFASSLLTSSLLTSSLQAFLQLDPSRSTELWRIFTCHFTHWDIQHLFWDVIMFGSLAAALEPLGRHRLAACLAGSAIMISCATLVLRPEISSYRGLSGIDAALFTMLLGTWIRDAAHAQRWDRISALATLGAGFVAKIAYELETGRAVFADSSTFASMPLAHIVGAAVGAAFAMLPRRVTTPHGATKRHATRICD